MNAPHLRRRYRASGTRSGLIYLVGIVAAASLYVAQHVYSVRQQCRVEALRREVEDARQAYDGLKAARDSKLSLAMLQPRAEALGLDQPDLGQMASLPLDAPVRQLPQAPARPPAFVLAWERIVDGLDLPGISSNEVQAGE